MGTESVALIGHIIPSPPQTGYEDNWTPGPWAVGYEFHGGGPAIIGDGDSVVAYLPDPREGLTLNHADAALIAAAPTIVSAAREACDALAVLFGCPDSRNADINSVYINLRAALQRVGGGA